MEIIISDSQKFGDQLICRDYTKDACNFLPSTLSRIYYPPQLVRGSPIDHITWPLLTKAQVENEPNQISQILFSGI
jgi:hypothetical protein